jgi:integrase
MAHEVSEGFIRKIGNNYFWRCVVDGQKQQFATGTADVDEAEKFMISKRAELLKGVADSNGKLRYEALRDAYVGSGKTIASNIQRDLDEFFGGMYVRAITVRKITEFKKWRESSARVLETKAETLEKEINLRKLREPGKKLAQITAEATVWVENGVKATTNKRLTILRAIFNFAAKHDVIQNNDVPPSFCLWAKVDNVRQGKFTDAQFKAIVKELSEELHPFVHFLYGTGMRSGQAEAITWDMIDKHGVLTMSGFLTKNGQPYTLPLKNAKGEAYDFAAPLFERKTRIAGEKVFFTANLRAEWREACDKLGLGVFDKETRSYRGAELHDFRRTAVYNMTAKGVGEAGGMSITGHRTSSVYKRYGIQDVDAQRSVLEQIQS